jgi:hypothetical protein
LWQIWLQESLTRKSGKPPFRTADSIIKRNEEPQASQ